MIFGNSLKYFKQLKYTHLFTATKLIRYNATNERNQLPAEDRLSEEITINQELSRNVGLNRFMQKVYLTTGVSLLAALATPYALLALPISSPTIYTLVKVGLVSSLIGFIGTGLTNPSYQTRIETVSQNQNIKLLVAKNSFMRHVLYGMGIFGLGLSVIPVIGMANMMNPAILPTALGLTAAIFGGASVAGYNMPKNALISYGRVLLGSLVGVIGLQLVGMGSLYFMGPTPFANTLMSTSTYFSAALFTVLVAYDTHMAVRMYENGRPDNLGLAANFVLDFWNIFVSILKILTRQR